MSKIIFLYFLFPIISYTQTPTIEWQKSIGGSSKDIAEKIILTSNGEYIIAGYSLSGNFDIPSNVGQNDIFVCKVNRFGQIIWKKSYGGIGDDLATGIVEIDNGFIVCGTSIGGNNDFFSSYGHTDIVLFEVKSKWRIDLEKELWG